MPKQRCLDCGKICYGWSTGPCPYCQSFNLEPLLGPPGGEETRGPELHQKTEHPGRSGD